MFLDESSSSSDDDARRKRKKDKKRKRKQHKQQKVVSQPTNGQDAAPAQVPRTVMPTEVVVAPTKTPHSINTPASAKQTVFQTKVKSKKQKKHTI